jgi:hypothetical protein
LEAENSDIDGRTVEIEENETSQEFSSNPSSQKTFRITRPARNLPSSGSKKGPTDLLSAVQELLQMNRILHEPASEEGGDEFDAFDQYMALSLKKLPINLVLDCQEKMHSLLTSYRLAAVATQSQPSSSSASEDPRIPLQFIPTTTNDLTLLVSEVMEDEQ